ncbi:MULTISPECIES: helix-turn-helix transcriptional regulator [unclassified Anaerobiospirillum]|uniref:helix-turn-helix domain-containing protein n=1 Tax=unclassified Anaerobiospirillum TaxID=2647410 RepID=UPI001FF3FD19|nr:MULTISPECIES: helix-turn-helix transcriptional regulator [unclassified Anaerobiospirillum]MCK0526019.1 helix-turn-helix domain-containing protein [Anaerobiospirillum sp. NML120449]MCK0535055.1 helix-turn-helix domain-containing protein [Anaerobiospirillum sp. NML120511]MCK0540180.1 helix-turn-helix domain-containing protein [Anaerobiospirillum sp. NML02-A-032]
MFNSTNIQRNTGINDVDFETKPGSPEDQLMKFIHETRKSMKISQRELSKMSGVNQSNLSKIENGIINPSIATIQKVAACLGHKVELRFVPDFGDAQN